MSHQYYYSTILFLIIFINYVYSSRSYNHINNDRIEWELFKKRYNKFFNGKTFSTQLIEPKREKIFHNNRRFVNNFNINNSTKAGFVLGINHLSDLFNSEINNLYGYKLNNGDNFKKKGNKRNSIKAQKYLDKLLSNNVKVPDSIDWRKFNGRVTAVKDQGSCSSCWAFATTGVLEGQLNVRDNNNNNNSWIQSKKNLIGLSEQNLVDCSKENKGCDGGTMASALAFIRKQNGIDNDDYYPYVGFEGDCRFDKNEVAITDSGGAFLTEGDEQELKAVVGKFGPVAVGIDSSDSHFMHYKSGVYFSNTCSNDAFEVNHGVLVVGYDTDWQYGDYWIVKNSWSSEWGEDGYIKMARNRDNNCGIASAAIIPTF